MAPRTGMYVPFPPHHGTPVALASPRELLRWQLRWRAAVAAIVLLVVTAFQRRGWFVGDPIHALLVLSAYLGTVVTAALAARSRPAGAWSGAAAVTILADVAALITLTAVSSRPGHHDWVLLVGFFVVHVAEFAFGRRVSLLAVCATAAGYVLLLAVRRDTPAAEWSEATFALVAFLAVIATFLSQFADRRRRLRRIIALFEAAERGDFHEAYDVDADRRPDVVTAVGGAYNRVRARLEKLVLSDALTGCLNRRGLEQALAREVGRLARVDGTVALLSLDVDAFKRINDTHGHLAGDDVLRQLGAVLLALVRSVDLVARTGGDEFLIICPDATMEGARQLALRLCERIAVHDFRGQGAPIALTVSVGIATIDLAAADPAAELQRRADRALYDAKRGGRNCVREWREAPERPATTT